jgi:hypothetical protein
VGNGNDPAQQRLAEHIGRERMLFSEYGWLPWAECFYISRGGVGTDSDLKTVSRGDLQHVRPRRRELSRLRRAYPRDGSLLPEGEFVYVPLQKDVNDFKFLSSPFANNEEFLGHLHSVIPDELQVLVKPHPLYERTYDLSPFDNFTDISGSDYSKRQLYRRMKAMICINSTSALEALLFERPVIAYGDDIFLNKDLVTYRPADQADMSRALDRPVDRDGCRRFISLLLSRQVNRLRCLADDHRYVESHHWVTSI